MQRIFDFPVSPRYDFDRFIVCGGNETAYRFARLLADPFGTENLLYLHGSAGSGKTHLLTAIHAGLSAAGGTIPPVFSFREIDRLYGGNYPTEGASRLSTLFRDAPALLLDDLHLVPDASPVRVELWQLFNDFYTSSRKIALAGLHPPKELPTLDDHLVSRLLWGLVARVDISDDDSRRLILKKLAADRQVLLPADVIDYLLLHTRRDLPALLGALEQIRRFALASGRKISVRLAREALVSEETER